MPWFATGTTSVTVLHPLTYLADVHLWFRHQCWAEAIKHRCEPLHENSGHAVTAIIQAAIATIGAGRVQWWTMRQKPKAYLETSVISYATSRLSRQLMVAAQQQYTTEWLEKVATRFDCFVSELVVEEAMQGDPGAAARRQQRLVEFAVLTIDPTARQLADELVRLHSIPARARTDALHVAIAAVNEMDYLVTWNCAHINNALMRPKIERCCAVLGYHCPVICTPLELEVDHD